MMEMISVFFSQPRIMAIFNVASLYQTGNIEDSDKEQQDNDEDGGRLDKYGRWKTF